MLVRNEKKVQIKPQLCKTNGFSLDQLVIWIFFPGECGRQQKSTDERSVCIPETKLCQKQRLLLLDTEAQS